MWTNLPYGSRKRRLELDVCARSGNNIVLFESKTKALTDKSRTGDIISAISDLAKSYLPLLLQLLRDERHVLGGTTPITAPDEEVEGLSVTKIAISPLSYGPISDKHLCLELMHAVLSNQLTLSSHDPSASKRLEIFKEQVRKIRAEIEQDGWLGADSDLRDRLFDVAWLDLGQLLYLLERVRTLQDWRFPLRNLTFVTRDVWTEIAFAERQGVM